MSKKYVKLHPIVNNEKDTTTNIYPIVNADTIDSENATNGQVLTADGQGRSTWQTIEAGGGVEIIDTSLWSIENTLINCSISSDAETITDGEAYTATITAATGYSLSNAYVKVYMNNVDITSTAYSSGSIAIDEVTGDLKIIALIVDSTFENNTWPAIFKSIRAGYVPLTWYEDTKELELTDDTVMTMRVVDTKAGRYSFVDGTVSHAVLLSDELFADMTKMENGNFNAGGIRAMSDYRNYVNNTIMPLLPTEFKNLLKEVYQVSNNGYNSGPDERSILVSKTILPAWGELFSTTDPWLSHERVNNGVDYGQYEYFEEHTASSYKIKIRIGQTSASNWFLRSPNHSYTNYWYNIPAIGSSYNDVVTSTRGIPLCIPV